MARRTDLRGVDPRLRRAGAALLEVGDHPRLLSPPLPRAPAPDPPRARELGGGAAGSRPRRNLPGDPAAALHAARLRPGARPDPPPRPPFPVAARGVPGMGQPPRRRELRPDSPGGDPRRPPPAAGGTRRTSLAAGR